MPIVSMYLDYNKFLDAKIRFGYISKSSLLNHILIFKKSALRNV